MAARVCKPIGKGCFRLITVQVESSDQEEYTPRLDEREMVRLCCALGMSSMVDVMASQLENVGAREFEGDLARFLCYEEREGGDGSGSDGSSCEPTYVTTVFGKQPSVKRYLNRVGAWDSDMDTNLKGDDLGVYMVLLPRNDGGGASRASQILVFRWLQESLFSHKRRGGAATYVLRCLTRLSTTVTVCLSDDDTRDLDFMVDFLETHNVDDWEAYGKALAEYQAHSGEVWLEPFHTIKLPSTVLAHCASVVKGSFPAVMYIATEPRTKGRNKLTVRFADRDAFVQWITERSKVFRMEFDTWEWSGELKKAVLLAAGKWPAAELEALDQEFRRDVERVISRVGEHENSADIFGGFSRTAPELHLLLNAK